METKKLILLILATILAIIVVILIALNLDTGDGPKTTTTSSLSNTTTIYQKVSMLSDIPVISPTIDKKFNKIKFYSATDGQAYQVDFAGQEVQFISIAKLSNLLKALWLPSDSNQVIGVFKSSTGQNSYYYNYETGQTNQLDSRIRSLDFSPTGKQIAYFAYDSKLQSGAVSIANPDGSNATDLFKSSLSQWEITWPNENNILIAQPGSGLAQSTVYSLNPTTKNYTKVLSELFGLSLIASLDNLRLVYSTTDLKGKNLRMFTSKIDGSAPEELPIKTIAKKCIFSVNSSALYCAIPQSIPANSLMPDDYYKNILLLKDSFIKYDFSQKQVTAIADASELPGLFDASALFLDPEENYLFFTNKRDGKLYNLKLE